MVTPPTSGDRPAALDGPPTSDERPAALAVKIATALDRLARARRGLRQIAATRHGVTLLQADLLAVLAESPASPPAVGRLARDAAVRQPTATDSLRALAAKGLVEQCRDPADRRRVNVALTPAGRDVVAPLRGVDGDLAAAISALPLAVQEAALEALVAVIARLVDRGAVDTARTCLTCRFHRPAGRAHHCSLLGVRFGAAGLRVGCADHQAA